MQLIERSLRRSFTFASEGQARSAADTVLRDLKAVGIRIFGPRRSRNPLPPAGPVEARFTGAADARSRSEERRD